MNTNNEPTGENNESLHSEQMKQNAVLRALIAQKLPPELQGDTD